VIAGLSKYHEVREAEPFAKTARKQFVTTFDFLQTKYVGRESGDEALEQLHPQAHGVDVPSGDAEFQEESPVLPTGAIIRQAAYAPRLSRIGSDLTPARNDVHAKSTTK
jgi:hypothetical protein